jgi:phospholipid/cholesterol/gamma-HCH transport system substrate-binding protein
MRRPMPALSAVVDRAARVHRSPNALVALGVALVTVLVATVVLIVATFRGAFTAYVPVDATITGSGDAVAPGDLVVYRDVPVGTVAGSGRVDAAGQVVVPLHIIPGRAANIPADVASTIDPITVFGTVAVILQAPARPTAAHLSSGELIGPESGAAGANVQGAVSNLDYILNALHPAQLDMALTAIATALRGEGRGLGHTLDSLDGYLTMMLPHFPLLEADLRLLAPVANQVAASAPALVGSLSNLAVTSETVTSHAEVLRQLLGGGATAAGQLDAVLAPTVQPLEAIIDAAGPFLRDLSQSPTELADIVEGLEHWAVAWSAAERSGPYLSFSTSVPLANATDLVFAAVGAPGSSGPNGLAAGALGAGNVDPPTYTSRAVPLADAAVRIDPALTTPAEVDRAATLAADLRGGRPVPSPAVAALALDPLLSDLAVSS